jgi:flagellar hook-associated protein 2
MATVGLNFGSATSGTGFDVTTTVNSILAIQQGIETPWQTQLTALGAQDTALSTIGTDLSSLTTAAQALTDADGVFAEKEGASSDTNVLTLTNADTTAVAGSHTIVVNQLATTASSYTDEVPSASATISGGVTIDGTTVSTSSSVDTLSTLAAAINADSLGVTASVISDVNGDRLSFTSSTSGAAGQAIISGMTGTLAYTTSSDSTPTTLNINAGVTGQDALLTVDGVSVDSASNTVSGAIEGVTFQLLATAPSESVQVQITNDNSDIETAVQTFVTAYNQVNTDLNTQEGDTSTGAAEPLFGSSVISQLQTSLQSALITGATSGSVSSISQLGITVNDDGSLTFDSSTMDALLNSNFADVQGFFQNPGSFGTSLTTTLNNLGTQAPDGAIYLAQQQDSAQETALNTDITNENALIATEKTTLTTELNTANETLQSIPEQVDEINQIYSAVTGYDENPNG